MVKKTKSFELKGLNVCAKVFHYKATKIIQVDLSISVKEDIKLKLYKSSTIIDSNIKCLESLIKFKKSFTHQNTTKEVVYTTSILLAHLSYATLFNIRSMLCCCIPKKIISHNFITI